MSLRSTLDPPPSQIRYGYIQTLGARTKAKTRGGEVDVLVSSKTVVSRV